MSKLDFSAADVLFATNNLGPSKVSEVFLVHVASSDTKKVMIISGIVGSKTNTTGNIYFYRASTTAVNMMIVNFTKDTKERGIVVGMIHPGGVDTDMPPPSTFPRCRRMKARRACAV